MAAKVESQGILRVMPCRFESPAENMGRMESAAFRRILFIATLADPVVAILNELRELNVFF